METISGYQIFLMVELARIAGIIEKDLEYDTTWETACRLYSEFLGGKYDIDTEPEYEFIEEFLKNYNEEAFVKFLSTCEKVDKNCSDEYVSEQLGKGIYDLRLNNVEYWVDGKYYTLADDGTLLLTIADGITKRITNW